MVGIIGAMGYSMHVSWMVWDHNPNRTDQVLEAIERAVTDESCDDACRRSASNARFAQTMTRVDGRGELLGAFTYEPVIIAGIGERFVARASAEFAARVRAANRGPCATRLTARDDEDLVDDPCGLCLDRVLHAVEAGEHMSMRCSPWEHVDEVLETLCAEEYPRLLAWQQRVALAKAALDSGGDLTSAVERVLLEMLRTEHEATRWRLNDDVPRMLLALKVAARQRRVPDSGDARWFEQHTRNELFSLNSARQERCLAAVRSGAHPAQLREPEWHPEGALVEASSFGDAPSPLAYAESAEGLVRLEFSRSSSHAYAALAALAAELGVPLDGLLLAYVLGPLLALRSVSLSTRVRMLPRAEGLAFELEAADTSALAALVSVVRDALTDGELLAWALPDAQARRTQHLAALRALGGDPNGAPSTADDLARAMAPWAVFRPGLDPLVSEPCAPGTLRWALDRARSPALRALDDWLRGWGLATGGLFWRELFAPSIAAMGPRGARVQIVPRPDGVAFEMPEGDEAHAGVVTAVRAVLQAGEGFLPLVLGARARRAEQALVAAGDPLRVATPEALFAKLATGALERAELDRLARWPEAWVHELFVDVPLALSSRAKKDLARGPSPRARAAFVRKKRSARARAPRE